MCQPHICCVNLLLFHVAFSFHVGAHCGVDQIIVINALVIDSGAFVVGKLLVALVEPRMVCGACVCVMSALFCPFFVVSVSLDAALSGSAYPCASS